MPFWHSFFPHERRIDRCRNFQLGISPSKPIYFFIPEEEKDLVDTFVDDHEFASLLNNCQKQYRYLSQQQEKGLKELAIQTKESIRTSLRAIARLFEKRGFSKEDFYKYVKIMDIPNIPEQSENLLLNSDKTPSGNDTADSDDWSGLDEP